MNTTKQAPVNEELYEIRKLLKQLVSYNMPVPKFLEADKPTSGEICKALSMLISFCENVKKEQSLQEDQVAGILTATEALARFDYSKKAEVSNKGSHLDALASAVNMLGEELKASTVSLQEKEILLKEIHHRIKNNLQLVSSLLNLQSTFINAPSTALRLRESQDRIRSIALLHEKLYETKDLKRINFVEYLEVLSKTLCETYSDKKREIIFGLRTSVRDPFLSMDTALPCGLILNELLTNAFKYAFKKLKKGKITVRIGQIRNRYSIEVSDNGAGIPLKLKIEESPTLGLQLVNTLVDQLHGKIKLTRLKGTSWKISFAV